MSISGIGWNTDQVIQINKSDMVLIQSTPVEIYRLDTDQFFRDLKDAERTADGMPWPDTQRNASPVTLGGITYARVLEVIPPYTVTFQDDQYIVQLTGSNNNIIERTNPNQVSIQGNNAAGLIQVDELQYSAYQNAVNIDQVGGTAGQSYPVGTVETKVNNIDDAKFIAALRGFDEFKIFGSYTFSNSDVLDNFIIQGRSAAKSIISIPDAATLTNNVFRQCTVDGFLDGGNQFSECIIVNLNYIDGSLLDCALINEVTLAGVQANFLNCGSLVAGSGPGQTPTLNWNGTACDVVGRGYRGGITFTNCTSTAVDCSWGLDGGRVVFDSSVVAGRFTIRGVGSLEDNTLQIHKDSGDLVIIDELAEGPKIQDMHVALGLDSNDPVNVRPTGIDSDSGRIDVNFTGDGTTLTRMTRQP